MTSTQDYPLSSWDDARAAALEATAALRRAIDTAAIDSEEAVGVAVLASGAIENVLSAAEGLISSRSPLGYCRADYPAAPLEPIGEPGNPNVRWCCLHPTTHCYDS